MFCLNFRGEREGVRISNQSIQNLGPKKYLTLFDRIAVSIPSDSLPLGRFMWAVLKLYLSYAIFHGALSAYNTQSLDINVHAFILAFLIQLRDAMSLRTPFWLHLFDQIVALYFPYPSMADTLCLRLHAAASSNSCPTKRDSKIFPSKHWQKID